MTDSIGEIFSGRINKNEMICFVNKNNTEFKNTIKLALSNKYPEAWRATWIIGHCMKKNDERLQIHIKELINSINDKKDGHQRELLKILANLKIPEEDEGYLFDTCMTIWETVNKQSSVRITAFRILINITKKYPELLNEIKFLTEEQYTEGLSPGIKNSFNKIIANL